MPRRNSTPSYRLHKASGQGIVTIPDGLGGRKDFLLGPHKSKDSYRRYHQLLAEWQANGRRLAVSPDERRALSMNELMLAYFRHAAAYYVKDGRATSEVDAVKLALRFVKRLYGDTPAAEFSPLRLKAVREQMVQHRITRTKKVKDPETGRTKQVEKVLADGLTRKCINRLVQRIRRMFAWAVEEELVSADVHAALLRVKGLRKGKTSAREKARVRPVAPGVVEQTLPHLPPMVADIVRVQLLAGMRPQEAVGMKASELTVDGPVWEYRPGRHKTEHHDRERVIFLGPKAQAVLRPYLPLALDGYLFSPRQSEADRSLTRRAWRVTPMTPSQARRRPRANRRRPPGNHYDTASYRRCILRACDAADVPRWAPNQLRHLAATTIRKTYGLEASQAVLGHAELGVTQVYAEADAEAARKVMAAIG